MQYYALPNTVDGSAKPSLKLGYRWIITTLDVKVITYPCCNPTQCHALCKQWFDNWDRYSGPTRVCGIWVHYNDVIITQMASQITSLNIVYSTVYSDADKKKPIKAPGHWPLCGEFTGAGEFPAQRASYAENVSIWWRHHVKMHFRLISHIETAPWRPCVTPLWQHDCHQVETVQQSRLSKGVKFAS